MEDPGQCTPPNYEAELRRAAAEATQEAAQMAEANAGTPPPAGAWWSTLVAAQQSAATHNPFSVRSPPRYSPDELLVRDQHVKLRCGGSY